VLIAPGDKENQAYPDANGGIGYVEGGEANLIATALLHVKIDKIHDMVVSHAVDEVADDAAKDEPEGDLAQGGFVVKVVPAHIEHDKGDGGDERKPLVTVAEDAPGGAGVAPVDESEESADNYFFMAQGQPPHNQVLGELVEKDDHHCHQGDAAIGTAQDGLGLSHVVRSLIYPAGREKTTQSLKNLIDLGGGFGIFTPLLMPILR
jgi:hypothetical protein